MDVLLRSEMYLKQSRKRSITRATKEKKVLFLPPLPIPLPTCLPTPYLPTPTYLPSTYLPAYPLPTYTHLPTLYLPTLYLPTPTYLPLPTYPHLPTPTYIHLPTPTYLPSTYPTYLHPPTFPAYLPNYLPNYLPPTYLPPATYPLPYKWSKVGGTHPTGMHSYLIHNWFFITINERKVDCPVIYIGFIHRNCNTK